MLPALIVFGGTTKRKPETTPAPTTRITTKHLQTTPTTTAGTAETKKSHFDNTQRVGREDVGYFNVPNEIG